MENKIIVTFHIIRKKFSVELEIPTDITIRELIVGLNEAYGLGIDISDAKQCYLKAENPIALLRGNNLISDYGLRNGSVINYTE